MATETMNVEGLGLEDLLDVAKRAQAEVTRRANYVLAKRTAGVTDGARGVSVSEGVVEIALHQRSSVGKNEPVRVPLDEFEWRTTQMHEEQG